MGQIALVLTLFVAALVLFAVERVSIDVAAILLLLALIATRTITPAEAFAGFGSDTVIFLIGLFVMTGALTKTGVIELLGRWLRRVSDRNPRGILGVVMVIIAAVSAFLSNTATTAVFLPIVLGLARRARRSPSKMLMPLAFASILGGTCTLLGTSTNIVVSGLLPKYHLPPLKLFELTPIGVALVAVGLAYMLLLGVRWLPEHAAESLAEEYAIRDYLSEALVLANSALVGKTVGESNLGNLDLTILGIVRGQSPILAPRKDEVLREGDLLLVEGKLENIIRIKDAKGIEIKAEVKLGDRDLQSDQVKMVEAMVLPGSTLIGSSLKEARFREHFGLTALAINRLGGLQRSQISVIPLRVGDVLLLQGSQENLARLRAAGELMILEDVSERRPRSGKAKYAVGIFAGAIALGGLEVLPFSVAAVLGAVLMFLTNCLTPREAYDWIDWRIIVLIGSMLSFGVAMEKTGTARFLAEAIVELLGPFGVTAVMTGFFWLTVLLTQPMSNQAAALVVLPVAINAARALEVNARSFAIVIALAASCSFLTPLEPSCVMVYGPGRYRFVDFLRVGALLTLLVFVMTLILVPKLWPLTGP